MTGYYQRPQQNQNKAPPLCNHCKKVVVVFDSNIRSQSGKMIPLDINTHEPHSCPENPYNQKQPMQQQQQQPTQGQSTQPNLDPVIMGWMQEIHESLDILHTLVRALKPNDVMTKEKEELLRENSELKEALIKLQEFRPASQLQQQQKTEGSEFTT